ncbi:HEAT repeat domain-containing protein [Gracilimonas sp.]|uniref:HEAT repeat domain-containing protein n=1 Tax=Gracilimonas sp. TaxID=1974203 RepID=UPI003BAC0292
MFDNPYDYYSNPEFWVLYFAVTLLVFLCVGFIGYTLTIRIANTNRIKKREKLRKKYAEYIYSFLSGDVELGDIKEKVENTPIQIPIFVSAVKHLKAQLKGKKDRQLHQLLTMKPIQDYYYEQLDDTREEQLIKALLYFREIDSIKESYYPKLIEWVKSEAYYLAHASASVILSSDTDHLHEEVLKTMCLKIEENRRTLIELLWDLWNNENLEHEQKLDLLKTILQDPETDDEVKVLIIRSIAEFGYAETGRFLKKLLDEIWNERHLENCKKFVAALIDALRRLGFVNAVPTIKKGVGSGIAEIEIACIKALAYFKTEEAIQGLQKVAESGEEYLLKELSFQMYHYSRLEEEIQIPSKYRRAFNPNYEPIKVI